jgi:acetylornithine deacetylase
VSDTLDLLARLVAVDSTSRGSNLGVIEIAEEVLDAARVPTWRVPSDDGEKANLIARIGPEAEGGVILSGHTDCVPVDGQPWTRDPFTLTEDGDRLYGRGTTDMKGFIAVALALAGEAAGAELARPLFLALSYDEEVGAIGAGPLVDELVRSHPRPGVCLVGEPTSMRLVGAHKGVRSFRTVIEGRDGHSSKPQLAANALAGAARLATFIDDLAAEHRHAAADPRFDPPYTTFNLATLDSGQAINIVPRHAELTWEYRPVPADDSDELRKKVDQFARDEVLPRMFAAHPGAKVTTEPIAAVPALASEDDGEAERLVRTLTGADEPIETVPFGTDGGYFQAADISTVIIGPGDIDQAHQPDEFIERSQLDEAERFVRRLIGHLTLG